MLSLRLRCQPCVLPFCFYLQPDPPTSNKWQLDNWLTKVNPPAVPTESPSDTAHTDGHEEDKEQPVSNASSCEHAVPREPHERSSIRAAQAPQDVHLPTKLSCQKSPVRAEEPSQRQTVGIKRPSKPPVHEEPKGGLKVESEPAPYEIGEQSSRDKPKPKTKSRSKSCDQKELKPRLQEAPKEKKHKSSHHADANALPDHRPVSDVLVGSAQEPSTLKHLPEGQGTAPTRTNGHRSAAEVKEGFHKGKLPVPTKEKKLLPPVRDVPGNPSLLVRIDLPLLSRVPQPPEKGNQKKRAEVKEHPGTKEQDLEKKSTDTPDRSFKKRKVRGGGGGGFVQGPQWCARSCLKNPCIWFVSTSYLQSGLINLLLLQHCQVFKGSTCQKPSTNVSYWSKIHC